MLAMPVKPHHPRIIQAAPTQIIIINNNPHKLLTSAASLFASAMPAIPVSKLPQTMDKLLHQFGSIHQSMTQLEAAQLRLPAFGRVEVLPGTCVCVSVCE